MKNNVYDFTAYRYSALDKQAVPLYITGGLLVELLQAADRANTTVNDVIKALLDRKVS